MRGLRALMFVVLGSATALVAATVPASAQLVSATGATPVYRLGPAALDSSGDPEPNPVRIPGLAGASIVQIAANDDHDLALTSSGKLYAWGSNFLGELGDGTKIDRPAPVPITVPAGVGKILQISSADIDNVALTSTGKILAWPGLIDGVQVLTPTVVRLPHNERAAAVSAGDDFVEYVTRGGEIWGWGSNFNGELGTGYTGDPQTPMKAHLPAGFVPHSVATGVDSTLALGTDTATGRAEVLAWGADDSGELGDGHEGFGVRSLLPVAVTFPTSAATITSLSAWGVASGAIDANGAVYTWGGTDSRADQDVPTAFALPGGAKAVALAVGVGYSLVTTSANQLLGWGVNTYGGLGRNVGGSDPEPTVIPLPTGTMGAVAHSFYATFVAL